MTEEQVTQLVTELSVVREQRDQRWNILGGWRKSKQWEHGGLDEGRSSKIEGKGYTQLQLSNLPISKYGLRIDYVLSHPGSTFILLNDLKHNCAVVSENSSIMV